MKTTKAHFKIFETAVRKWATDLGLRDWEIFIKHEADAPDALATLSKNSGRTVWIGLAQDWGKTHKITKLAMQRTALHEVCHLLLYDLVEAAKERCIKDGEIEELEHKLVYLLENVLLGDAE